MKKNKFFLLLPIIVFLILVVIIIPKNKYVCLNKSVKLGDKVNEKDLRQCITIKKVTEEVIVSNNFFNFNQNKEYTYIGDTKKANKFLHIEDFSVEEQQIELTDKITIKYFTCHNSNNVEENQNYELYISDKKLYVKNILTGNSKIIFDRENVSYIAKRNYCCDASARLIILTEKGNVYISDQDLHYRDKCNDYDFSFKNYNLKDIVEFKDYYIFNTLNVGKLYAIDKKGNSYLIEDDI